MTELTEYELEQLVQDAGRADRGQRPRDALEPRIRRLLEEQRTLRDEAGQRERMAAEERSW